MATDEQIREAAIAVYMEEHPTHTRATAEEMVDRVLATMSRAEAEALYVDRINVETDQVPDPLGGRESLPVGTPESPPSPPSPEELAEEQESEFLAAVEEAGVIVAAPDEIIGAGQFEELLRRYGAELDAPEIQLVLSAAPSMTFERADGLAQALAAEHPSAAQTQYADVLEQAGFSGPPIVIGVTTPSELQGVPPELVAREGGYIRQPETGWLQYTGGVLANPDTGEVVFDPNSTAPGSALWRKEIQESWSEEKILAERRRLVEYGYLSKEEAKLRSFDARFLGALQAYHLARYANFGKPIADDLGLAAASRPPLVDFEDFRAQTRNDVREQYRRVLGEDPTDGEVEAFTDMIVRKGMELQKLYRRKGYSSYSSLAATEAEELFVERLEQSPQAQFLRDAEEENTQLRDALQQSVVVMNSLAG